VFKGVEMTGINIKVQKILKKKWEVKMVEILFEKDKAVLKFPKELLVTEYVQKFIERLKIETIVEKSKLTEEQATALAEEIKKEWWERNKEKFLEKIKD